MRLGQPDPVRLYTYKCLGVLLGQPVYKDPVRLYTGGVCILGQAVQVPALLLHCNLSSVVRSSRAQWAWARAADWAAEPRVMPKR